MSTRLSGSGIMSAYVWQDGRLLGFDAVEWMTWVAAVTGLALLTLPICRATTPLRRRGKERPACLKARPPNHAGADGSGATTRWAGHVLLAAKRCQTSAGSEDGCA